jgi:hypothetical protein
MKSLLGEERSFIIESDDDEEDPTHNDAGAGDDGSSSDSSSCATPRAGGGDGSHPNSYTNQWPQSYRYSPPSPPFPIYCLPRFSELDLPKLKVPVRNSPSAFLLHMFFSIYAQLRPDHSEQICYA